MIELYYEGYCPESLLKGEKVEMRLNEDDFWESEKTGLQIAVFPPFAAILRWRGKGQFKDSKAVASDSVGRLILTGTSDEEGEEIFPDDENMLTDKYRFDWYLGNVYPSKEEYDAGKFNPNDPRLEEQERYLKSISKEEWSKLFELYDKTMVENNMDGFHYESFDRLHHTLYDLNLVFNFDWPSWKKGQKDVTRGSKDFDDCTLLQLSMYLTTIFRLDHFNEGLIESSFKKGTIPRLFTSLKRKVGLNEPKERVFTVADVHFDRERNLDSILNKVGLKAEMLWTEANPDIFAREDFIIYPPPGYLTSEIHDTDEAYNMSESVFLHLKTGLRVGFTETENYVGDKVEYKAHEVFVIDDRGKRHSVLDIDFDRGVFVTDNALLTMDKASKSIP